MLVAYEDYACPAVGHDEIELFLRASRVHGYCCQTVVEAAEFGNQNLGRVGTAYGNGVLFLSAEDCKRIRRDIYLRTEIRPSCGQPFAVFAPTEPVSFPVAVFLCLMVYCIN